MSEQRKRWPLGRTLVIGLGNPIRRDDGVGPAVVRRLAARGRLPPNVELGIDMRGGLRLMERLVDYRRAVVVDALLSGRRPGTVLTLGLSDVTTAHTTSIHDVGLATALNVGRLSGAVLPDDEDIAIVAIEVADIYSFGESLTPEVEAAAEVAAKRVLELVG